MSREKCDFLVILCGFSVELLIVENQTRDVFCGHPITNAQNPGPFLADTGECSCQAITHD
jgi:hypothetical protein